ncbi:MAG TPA: PIN domain-containing protein [Miltoncostaeaceae bacterium]|nr:PIN domain-containing protein [Miltoncostaeaceae bacterium]
MTVFDADVLIGVLNRDDVHHVAAVERLRAAADGPGRLLVSAVTFAEVLVGPRRAGRERIVEEMADALRMEVVAVDRRLAGRAAAVRATTALRTPDAFVVATTLAAAAADPGPVRLETFDRRLAAAYDHLSRSAHRGGGS